MSGYGLLRRSGVRAAGVTLVEVLVAIAVVVIMLAILFPILGTVQNEKDTLQCAANLRQLVTVFAAYSNDYRGQLPPGNVANASTFYYDDAVEIDRYLKAHRVNPSLFYCPGRLKQLSATSKERPEYWLSKEVPHYIKHHETVIGYFYLGNPSRRLGSAWKLRQQMPRKFGEISAESGQAMPFIFDKITGPRKNKNKYNAGSALTSSYMTADENPNLLSPHRSFGGRSIGGNMGLSDGAVIRKETREMKLGYTYHAPSEVYW